MAQWQDLSQELTRRILDWFSLIVIHEYTDLGLDPWNPRHFPHAPSSWEAFEAPPSPAPLQNYASAVKTCHYFRNTIKKLKFQGKAVPKVLQSMQHQRLKQLVTEA